MLPAAAVALAVRDGTTDGVPAFAVPDTAAVAPGGGVAATPATAPSGPGAAGSAGAPGSGGAGFDPGLNAASPGGDIVSGGLIERMRNEGIPVINLVDIKKLAQQYKLPVNPATTPDLGQGGLYRDWLQLRIVAGLLVLALTGVFFAARFIALAPATDAVDTYFGTAPRTFRAWIRSFGVRWPSRPAPQESSIEK